MNDKAETVDRLLRQLEAAAELRQSTKADAETQAARQRLRAWQAARLARTHADLLASPQTGPAACFFLTDLYGPVDLDELAGDVKRIVPIMTRLLPTAALETVADAIELDALSEDLRQPAHVAGVGLLHDFLERGYAVFSKIERVDDFLDPIVARERKLMEALFAGDDSLLEV